MYYISLIKQVIIKLPFINPEYNSKSISNLRNMSEKQVTLQYKDDYFFPISFITKELGITFDEDVNWITNEFEATIGEPISSRTYINDNTGYEETECKYDGATLITGRKIEITKPLYLSIFSNLKK